MEFIIKQGADKNIYKALDSKGNVIGEGFVSPFLPSDLYDTPLLNIYMSINVEDVEKKFLVKDQLFESLLKRSYEIREEHKDKRVRVYHCCFSNDQDNIDYYSSKDGFIHDEGMHILRNSMDEINVAISEIEDIEILSLHLDDETEILNLIAKHKTVFKPGYTLDEIKELKKKSGWKNIAAVNNGEIVANIMLFVSNDDLHNKVGWIEDLFVCSNWRKKGIAKNLVIKGLEHFKGIGVSDVSVEVWSANKRAVSLYEELGFKFFEETESSIGMYI